VESPRLETEAQDQGGSQGMNWLSPILPVVKKIPSEARRRTWRESKRRARRGQTMSRREAARQANKVRWGKC